MLSLKFVFNLKLVSLRSLLNYSKASKHYAYLMVEKAKKLGWPEPKSTHATNLARVLKALEPHVKPQKFKVYPEWAEFVDMFELLLRELPKALTVGLSEEERTKLYAALLRAGAYRSYRRAIYRLYAAPLFKKGAGESVLLVGAGITEPYDFIRAVDVPVEIWAQEVDPDVADAIAAGGFNVIHGPLEAIKDMRFTLAVVQGVLHWADDPQRLLEEAARLADYVLISQGWGPQQGAVFAVAAAAGAKTLFFSWKDIHRLVEAAGLRPAPGYPFYKHPVYLGLFKTKAKTVES